MNQERFNQRLNDYQKAVERLEEALNDDVSLATSIMDGGIHRFEFCFELSWKTMKDYLALQGIEVLTPREIIKEAYQKKMINDGEAWLQMLDARNNTSHLYDEQIAKEIYSQVKNVYFKLLLDLAKLLKEK